MVPSHGRRKREAFVRFFIMFMRDLPRRANFYLLLLLFCRRYVVLTFLKRTLRNSVKYIVPNHNASPKPYNCPIFLADKKSVTVLRPENPTEFPAIHNL
jgi:hypothetical protein